MMKNETNSPQGDKSPLLVTLGDCLNPNSAADPAPTLSGTENALELKLRYTETAMNMSFAYLPLGSTVEITLNHIKHDQLCDYASKHLLPVFKVDSFEECWVVVLKDHKHKGCTIKLSTATA